MPSVADPDVRALEIDRAYIAQTGEIPAGYQLIRDSIPFKIVDIKRTLTESLGKKIPIMRCTGVFQRADEKNANGRVYPLSILDEAVEALQDPIKTRQVMGEFDHPCLISDDFRVLTVDGWKKFVDVKVDDYVYSRVSGQMVRSRVNAVINEPYSGKAYKLDGKYIDVAFTPPHKIVMDTRSDNKYEQRQVEATLDEIYHNRKKFNRNTIPRKAEWNGQDQDVYVIPAVSKEELHNQSVNYYKNVITDDLQINLKTFVSFLGLYLAEGCLASNHGVIINQTKEEYKPLIRAMLAGFPQGLQWAETDNYFHLSDMRLNKYLEKLGNKYQKYIPHDIKQLDAPYLEELVRWFQIGDGRQKHGRNNVFSTSKQLIDDLHECWIKAGGCCYLMTIITEEDYEFAGHIIKAENKQPLYQLTLSETNGIHLDDRFLKIEPFNHNGNIYCLTTEHGNFYMEHKGCSFWTGNSDAKIHLDRISHLITKLWVENKTVYGELEVINDERCPCGSMLACYLDRGIQVGVSSRGVGDMEIVMREGEDTYEVQPGFRFVTFDAVAEPSVKGTQLQKLNESLQRKVSPRVLKEAREKLLLREIGRFLGS